MRVLRRGNFLATSSLCRSPTFLHLTHLYTSIIQRSTSTLPSTPNSKPKKQKRICKPNMPSVATQNHAPAQRTREQPQAELEASSELKLGDFSDVPSLSPSEARLLINAVLDARRKLGMKREETEYVYSPRDEHFGIYQGQLVFGRGRHREDRTTIAGFAARTCKPGIDGQTAARSNTSI